MFYTCKRLRGILTSVVVLVVLLPVLATRSFKECCTVAVAAVPVAVEEAGQRLNKAVAVAVAVRRHKMLPSISGKAC